MTIRTTLSTPRSHLERKVARRRGNGHGLEQMIGVRSESPHHQVTALESRGPTLDAERRLCHHLGVRLSRVLRSSWPGARHTAGAQCLRPLFQPALSRRTPGPTQEKRPVYVGQMERSQWAVCPATS